MQNAYKHQAKTLKTWMHQGNMKLHAKWSKFHIEHTRNGATVQHIHSKQDIATICPKQQLGILQASKQYATAPQHNNKRHGHEVQVKHDKTWTLSYLQKSLEHAPKGHGKIANNNSFRLSRNNIRLQCLELSNNMFQELIMTNKGTAWIYSKHATKVP